MISGRIQPSAFVGKFNANRLTSDKIIQASMIQRVANDGVQVMLVLQFVDEIICFNLARKNHI